MTDKVQLIKEEIERLKTQNETYLDKEYAESAKWYKHGAHDICFQLLNFIDSLPEGPSSEDFEREIGKYTTNHLLKKRNHSTGVYHLTQKDCDDIARHFAEWQKQQMKESLQNEYEKGRLDMREEMMKDAVEGIIHHFADDELAAVHYNDPKGTPMSIYVSSKGLSAGDKVKIIIVKTEQQ